MNKTELISAVAKATELKRSDADKAVNAVITAIQTSLKKGERVQLIGFGRRRNQGESIQGPHLQGQQSVQGSTELTGFQKHSCHALGMAAVFI